MNIAYYMTNKTDKISIVKKYYLQQDGVVNFFILYEDTISEQSICDTACINAYSKSWIRGKIIFTNIEDYLKNREEIIADSVLLVNEQTLNSLVSNQEKVLKVFDEILIEKDESVERINYERL